MELFKTNLLKREYHRFQNEVLINVLECGLCQSFSHGESDKKVFLGCDRCRKAWCQPCIIFNIAKQTLLENLDREGRKYLKNFIKDFLNLSNKTLQDSFGGTKITLPRAQTYNVKSYHKSKKCRNQVVYRNLDDCKKIEFIVKGQKRSYYKKF